ncbi:MAG: calcium-binding protein [Waterburya sp.]
MSTYYNEAPEAEYEYKQYKEYAEYKAPEPGYENPGYEAPEYWTPTYQEVQEKYSDDKYAEKQYLPEETAEGYGKETADYVIGNQGDNVIQTYEEQDVVEGGYGSDKIDAGKGDDLIYGFAKEHNPMDEKYAQAEYERQIGIQVARAKISMLLALKTMPTTKPTANKTMQ